MGCWHVRCVVLCYQDSPSECAIRDGLVSDSLGSHAVCCACYGSGSSAEDGIDWGALAQELRHLQQARAGNRDWSTDKALQVIHQNPKGRGCEGMLERGCDSDSRQATSRRMANKGAASAASEQPLITHNLPAQVTSDETTGQLHPHTCRGCSARAGSP